MYRIAFSQNGITELKAQYEDMRLMTLTQQAHRGSLVAADILLNHSRSAYKWWLFYALRCCGQVSSLYRFRNHLNSYPVLGTISMIYYVRLHITTHRIGRKCWVQIDKLMQPIPLQSLCPKGIFIIFSLLVCWSRWSVRAQTHTQTHTRTRMRFTIMIMNTKI